ncbi:CRISPR-associated endonuclease Cas2 [Halodesulfovibrio sp.]|jgi:CRISPR-associated protein Cas2|uniref:CRISPR-associated endonuclease Cas2 n=1 Tax=Halodesulfovibrio sp. TaxID=1912772 RepID=UPI0025F409D0|nr:CRISPR-associated endonuclease Cas2 [Halodesulfovibrio sp.]MCT4533780.1 CRISPR-associated endonuclease Cas2 [Halodesulfovibrio sp.]
MRLLVFFDLPVKTKEQRRDATRFRNFLLKDGYDMMQLSVYCRICRGQDMVDKHVRRLTSSLPPAGCVRVLQVTEKQYERMHILIGEPRPKEIKATEQLLLF